MSAEAGQKLTRVIVFEIIPDYGVSVSFNEGDLVKYDHGVLAMWATRQGEAMTVRYRVSVPPNDLLDFAKKALTEV